jgi:hypothetical protein
MSFQWAITFVLVALWGLCAYANASIAWTQWTSKTERSPSFVPFVGGLMAVIAYSACPWKSPYKAVLLLLALLLDLGSLPFILLLAFAAVTNPVLWREFFRSTAKARWGTQWGVGFLLWLLVSGGVVQLAKVLKLDDDYAFGGVTLVFWIGFAVFLIWVRKYAKP